jgi:hypothetical protein
MKTNQIITLGLVAVGAVIVYNKFFKKPSLTPPSSEPINAGGIAVGTSKGGYGCHCQQKDGTYNTDRSDAAKLASNLGDSGCDRYCRSQGAASGSSINTRMFKTRAW